MSLHKSLKNKGQLVRTRNVYNRAERIAILVKEGRWSEDENSPFGLPKVRIVKIKKRTKERKTEAEEGEEAEAQAAPEGTAD